MHLVSQHLIVLFALSHVLVDARPPLTRQEPCFLNGTLCVLYSSIFSRYQGLTVVSGAGPAAYITSLPAFEAPHRLSSDLGPRQYEKVTIPGRKIGLVAKKHIAQGDLILSEVPVLMVDFADFGSALLRRRTQERVLELAVDMLPARTRAEFLRLSTGSRVEEDAAKIIGAIMDNNAFMAAIGDDKELDFGVLMLEISRINHDCRPNTSYWFDTSTFRMHVRATRPIMPGEEILLSYIDPLLPRKDRLRSLSGWGFECQCSACTLNTPYSAGSEARLTEIEQIRSNLVDYSRTSHATPQMAERMVSLLKEERVWADLCGAYKLAAIEWNAAGDAWRAFKVGQQAVSVCAATLGAQNEETVDLEELIRDPPSHWSWRLRQRS